MSANFKDPPFATVGPLKVASKQLRNESTTLAAGSSSGLGGGGVQVQEPAEPRPASSKSGFAFKFASAPADAVKKGVATTSKFIAATPTDAPLLFRNTTSTVSDVVPDGNEQSTPGPFPQSIAKVKLAAPASAVGFVAPKSDTPTANATSAANGMACHLLMNGSS
jgi:hypothetical protein